MVEWQVRVWDVDESQQVGMVLLLGFGAGSLAPCGEAGIVICEVGRMLRV